MATNNFYGYSNATVDGLFDELQVATEQADQEPLLAQIETELVNDAFGVTIFQFPGVTAWNPEKIGNVSKLIDRADDLLRLLGLDRGRGCGRVIQRFLRRALSPAEGPPGQTSPGRRAPRVLGAPVTCLWSFDPGPRSPPRDTIPSRPAGAPIPAR